MAHKLIPSIINLTNYAIGATLMTIPYSFSECGIVLSLVLVILIAVITVAASELLLESGVQHRKTAYESLCMSSLGGVGKAVLELNMVGMMYGSLVAYVIIIGDLGSEIVHEQMGFSSSVRLLRPVVLSVLALLLITPLCLKRDMEKLANASALSLLFYLLLTLHLLSMSESEAGVARVVSLDQLNWWRARGIIGVIPIFSLGFTIQTQIFPVFNSIADSTVAEMKFVIRLCTVLVALCYSAVGIFGYWKFSRFSPRISADLLSMYSSSSSAATLMKIGFLGSVAISYPLTVFPVRTSLYSLLFIRSQSGAVTSDLTVVDPEAIPERHFTMITFGIIISSFVLGFMTNNIEVVLSLTGSFSGSIVLFILPALIFIKTKSLSRNRWVANLILVFGLAILALSFLNTWSTEQPSTAPPSSRIINQSHLKDGVK